MGSEEQLFAPARVKLYNLAPIGIGTPAVESLESYVCRLAKHHGIARGTLESFVSADGPQLYKNRRGPLRLDAPAQYAALFAARLAALTGRPEVSSLGLARYASRLSTSLTLRQYRAWCPDCFHDARVAGVEAHLPLLWSLEGFERCVVHFQALEKTCPGCGRMSVPIRSWNQRLDHCPTCNKDLAVPRVGKSQSFAELSRKGDEPLDRLFGNALAKFVADSSTRRCLAGKADIRLVIESAIRRGLVSHEADFALRAGLTAGTLSTLKIGHGTPSLATLLRVACAAQVALAGVFDVELWKEDRRRPPAALARKAKLRRRRALDWISIRDQCTEALARGEAVSLSEMSRRFEIDFAGFVLGIGPELWQKLKARGKAVRAERRIQTLEGFVRRIADACGALEASRTRVTASEVARHLQLSLGSKYFQLAFKEVRRRHPG